MILDRFNFAIDPLYGCFKLDPLVRALAVQPEIQRLRDVRLSNINSMFLLGTANISRYEHSLGVAHLAGLAADSLQLNERERLSLACAALLHDVGITPFGHLMEEAFRWSAIDFDHESRLRAIFLEGAEVGNVDAPLFRGRPAGVRRVIDRKEFKQVGLQMEEVFDLKAGKGAIGKLLNGTIDIDNIDNVCRMAYHMGLPFRRQLGVELVQGFYIADGELSFDAECVSLIHEWLALREQLYDLLMTNPFDFVAKAMMIEAMRRALLGKDGSPPVLGEDDWKLTDSELVARLLDNAPTARLMDALLRGDLHGLYGLYWIEPDSLSGRLLQPSGIQGLREELARSLGVAHEEFLVYVIKDKRVRKIDNLRIEGRISGSLESIASVGDAPRRYLFGACTGLQMHVTGASARKFQGALSRIFGISAVVSCDPAASITKVFGGSRDTQPSLF
jgi:HD superfamily phosphohydrolase